MPTPPAPKPTRTPTDAKRAGDLATAEAQRFADAAIGFINATTRLMTDAQNKIFADRIVHHFRTEQPTRTRRK